MRYHRIFRLTLTSLSLQVSCSYCHSEDIDLNRFIRLLGDFEEVYGGEDVNELESLNEPQAGKWNAILTCFFIDTVRAYLLSPRVAPMTSAIRRQKM